MSSNYGSYSSFSNHFSDYKSDFVDAKKILLSVNKRKGSYGSYTIVNVGMGCVVYLKCGYSDRSISGYFVHNDCNGQYGVNDLPKALEFVKNHNYV